MSLHARKRIAEKVIGSVYKYDNNKTKRHFTHKFVHKNLVLERLSLLLVARL